MHIPDGVVDPAVMAGAGAASVAAVAWAAREVRRGHPRWGLALAGAGAVLVGHLADVPLAGGHTGHLVGGTLLAIALGPALAVLVMAAVLTLEATLLGDGGIAALGVNVLVMAVVGVLAGYGGYRAVRALVRRASAGRNPSLVAIAAGVGAWVSVVASAATLTGLETLGGAAGAFAAALMPQYASWGLLEAAVTGGAVAVALAWSGQVARLRGVAPGPRAVRARDGEVAALA